MTSIGDWLTSSDHKKIGRLYVGVALLFAVAVGILGAITGFERMGTSGYDLIPGDSAIQVLAAYRFLLVMGVLAPLFVGLAIAVVPMQVGSRAISFPRVAQLGFWTWFFGSVLVIVSLIANGGPGGGEPDMVDMYLLALPFVAAGLGAGALSVATTVLTSRAPGMTTDRVPPFSWSALVGSLATLLLMPVIIGTSIYLYVDNSHAKVAFGGNKKIDEHLGFALTQPATLVLVIMALGVFAEIGTSATRQRHPLRPVMQVGLGLMSAGLLGAVTQSQHQFAWEGSLGDKIQSALPWLLFNGLPLLGVLVAFGGVALAFKDAAPKISAPLVLSASGALMILVGVAGNFVATISDTALSGTVFEEGVLLYLVLGGLLSALAGCAFWAPKLSGKLLDDKNMSALGALGLLGTIAAAFPLYVAGFLDQPAAKLTGFNIDGPDNLLNLLSGIGMLVIVLVVAGYVGLMLSASTGAADDPWDGQTLEWSIPSPAPRDNFESLALVGSPEPLLDVKPQEVSA